ncbi:GH32 C-terminal domain-containing protein [Salinivibrio costicola]|uniref:GH32 C-terminal domain-containing protein n=1 Tax=Salinivibrio costicola TaxID=51367 RepID=UPI0006884A7B|nr:GH32 C-terminal domain-containing protein [Salinivibrio costicola]
MHQLTCPRELRWENGQIYQRPATALQRLRGPQQLLVIRTESDATSVDLGTKQFELSTSLPIPKSGQYTLYFHSRSGIASHATSTEPSGCALTIDGNNRTLTLDRSTSLATEGDTRRCIHLPEQLEELPLQVLADTSSLEFFIGNGQWTMTSRYFSATDATFLAVTRDHHDVPLPKEIDWYALKKASVG